MAMPFFDDLKALLTERLGEIQVTPFDAATVQMELRTLKERSTAVIQRAVPTEDLGAALLEEVQEQVSGLWGYRRNYDSYKEPTGGKFLLKGKAYLPLEDLPGGNGSRWALVSTGREEQHEC